MTMSAEQPALAKPEALDFSAVAEAHLDDVYGYLLYLTKSPDLAEDLTADTFERALKRLAGYDRRRGEIRGWLLVLARSTALDHFRAESRRRRREQAAFTGQAEDSGAAFAQAFAATLPEELRAALTSLSALDRELVYLRVVLELGNAEAAKLLSLTPTACATRLSRTLKRLQEKVNRDEL